MPRGLLIRSTLIAAAFCFVLVAHAMAAPPKAVRIPPGPLVPALESLSKQMTLELIYEPKQLQSYRTAGVSGTYTARDAVKLLLKGTPLEVEVDPSGAMAIVPAGSRPPGARGKSQHDAKEGKSDSSGGFRLARVSRAANSGAPSAPSGEPSSVTPTPPLSPAPAGQATSNDVLQEVVVSATRRQEGLSRVPVSVSAYTQDMMDIRGIRDATDIARYTPGVTIDTEGTNSITIRGIGSSGGAGTTGIYIDDTPIQMRAMGVNADETLPKTFDMERVEVLRGPQGTLFGAGSEGGTVRYIMTQPSLTEFSAYARSEVSYTEDGSPNYEAGVALGGPIIDDTLGFRVSAWYRHDGGWIDRISPTTQQPEDSDGNYDDTAAVRAALTWAPTAAVRVTPSVMFQNRYRNDVEYYWPLYSDPDSGKFVSADFSPLHEPDQFWLPALKATADFDSMELVSDSSYYRRRDTSGYDGTLYNMSYYQTLGWAPGDGGNASGSSPYAGTSPCAPEGFSCYPLLDGTGVHLPAALSNYLSPNTVTNNQDTETQEIRLQSNDPRSRVQWTVGAFYSISRSFSLEAIHDPEVDELFEYLYGTTIANVFGTATNPNGSSYLPMGDSYFNELTGHDRQLAGFGEAVWSLTDRLKLTTGVRYSDTSFSFVALNGGPQNGGPGGGSGTERQSPVTERAGLSFQADPDNMFYATYSTGFRVGGANSAIPYSVCATDFEKFGLSGAPDSYKSDNVRNYEIGSKNNLNHRVKLDASVYYIQWNDIQQNVVLPTCGLGYIANLGAAVSEGGDLQADIALSDALSLESAIGYTDARYSTTALPGPLSNTPLVASGDAITGRSGNPAAPWTMTLGVEYRFLVGGRDSYMRVDAEHYTKNNRPTAAEDPATVQFGTCSTLTGSQIPCTITPPAFTFVSARLGTQLGDWSVSAFVDNLLNAHPVLDYNYQPTDGFGPQPAASPLYRYITYRPRTIGLTLTYRR
jgi:iron complex outermembrane recepter protein